MDKFNKKTSSVKEIQDEEIKLKLKRKEKELRQAFEISKKAFIKQEKTQIELEFEIKKLKRLEYELKKLKEIGLKK